MANTSNFKLISERVVHAGDRETNCLLTINSNKCLEESDPLYDRFLDGISSLFSSEPSNYLYNSRDPDSALRLRGPVDVEAVAEYGGKFHKYHLHILIKIPHYDDQKIFPDLRKESNLRLKLREALGYNPFISNRFVKGDFDVRRYQQKEL
jgi:hypothetical protein